MAETLNMRLKAMILSRDPAAILQLTTCLEQEYFQTLSLSESSDLGRLMAEFQPDILILDQQLRELDGLELCKRLRPRCQLPILMLSQRKEVMDCVLALELGCDDYMVKPFDSRELVARVKALLRRCAQKEAAGSESSAASADSAAAKADNCKCLSFPGLTINLTNYTVLLDTYPVEMPPRELELLYFLASSPNQVFTREQLLDHVWGYEYLGDTRTVDVHIKRIRSRLGSHRSWSITTVWGVGYKFQRH